MENSTDAKAERIRKLKEGEKFENNTISRISRRLSSKSEESAETPPQNESEKVLTNVPDDEKTVNYPPIAFGVGG